MANSVERFYSGREIMDDFYYLLYNILPFFFLFQ